jgi:hypothetical protein
MRVRFPLPAPSILFIFNGFRGNGAGSLDISGTKPGTVHILFIFKRLRISGTYPSPANYIKLASFTPNYGMRSG